jgi:hypothetical protein
MSVGIWFLSHPISHHPPARYRSITSSAFHARTAVRVIFSGAIFMLDMGFLGILYVFEGYEGSGLGVFADLFRSLFMLPHPTMLPHKSDSNSS